MRIAPGSPLSATRQRYFDRSRQPLEILALLAPLIVFYEAALLGFLRSGEWVMTNRAHGSLLWLFDALGVRAERLLLPALSLPALAIVMVLLVWQILSRRPWSVHLPTVAGMAAESALTALPLVTLGWLLAPILALGSDAQVRSLPLAGRVAMAIGAGIYEEFVFRLVLLSLLHSILRRVPRLGEPAAITGAVLLSAVAFSLHHPLLREDGFALHEAVFLFGAGVWWGVLFVVRGLGIAVGSHAAYDALVLLWPLLSARASA